MFQEPLGEFARGKTGVINYVTCDREYAEETSALHAPVHQHLITKWKN